MNLVYFFIRLGTTGFSSRDIGVRRDGWAGQSGERRGVEVRRERHSLACPVWFLFVHKTVLTLRGRASPGVGTLFRAVFNLAA